MFTLAPPVSPSACPHHRSRPGSEVRGFRIDVRGRVVEGPAHDAGAYHPRCAPMPNDSALLAGAVANNAAWCAAVCRAHGIDTATSTRLWSSPVRTPPLYPDAVTLVAGCDPAEVLASIDAVSPGASVKDSYHDVDLADHGFAAAVRGIVAGAGTGCRHLNGAAVSTVPSLVCRRRPIGGVHALGASVARRERSGGRIRRETPGRPVDRGVGRLRRCIGRGRCGAQRCGRSDWRVERVRTGRSGSTRRGPR